MTDATREVLVEPGIRALPLRTPTLPPATHTNAYLVGEDELVLVEPASPYPEEIEVAVGWAEAHVARGPRLAALVLTHHHVDHVGGAVALRDRLGAPIWAHRATAERLAGIVSIDRLLDDGERIDLGSMTLRAVHTPGHAPGHLCFHEPDRGFVIAGDMVASIGTILVEPTDGDMTLYLDSLARMRGLRPTRLLPAHGAPIEDADARLAQYIAHRLMREAKVLAALRQQRAPSGPRELVPIAYDDAPQAVWPLAELSIAAHLEKLVADGSAALVEGGFVAT